MIQEFDQFTLLFFNNNERSDNKNIEYSIKNK